jgi:hypothetical protein
MHINKVNVRINKPQWCGLYYFLFNINFEVITALNTRHAHLEVIKYVLYDICKAQVSTQAYHLWANRPSNKFYTLSLPIGQAVALCQYCFGISYADNPDLHSFIGVLYKELNTYISGHQFTVPNVFFQKAFETETPRPKTKLTDQRCSGHECFFYRTGVRCVTCKL